MNKEIIKQLKDAGFPIKICECGATYIHPTLSELIEACGDRFGELKRVEGNIGNINWVATELGGVGYASKTPEEAVKNLWIKLNKK